MTRLLHELIQCSAEQTPNGHALGFNHEWLTYHELQQQVEQVSRALLYRGLKEQQRVAIYLPKCFENVLTMFATSQARGVFVPINPVVKAPQASHIIQDCDASVLVTNYNRWRAFSEQLKHSAMLTVIVDLPEGVQADNVISWHDFMANSVQGALPTGMETDIAAIFYTSGSTGRPKGVTLTQRNMVLGAQSVAEYLESGRSDRMLAALPLSFDYGFSQLTIAFTVGASCYLLEFLFPKDILTAASEQNINCLACVPPLWIKLSELDWPENLAEKLRYFTNSGGVMPLAVLAKLRAQLPNAKPYLMYGLTEAFRSCYLPPEDIERKAGSFGKAIPNVELKVIDQDGAECAPGQPGELVHLGPLVSMGYWNDKEKSAERFKPAPGCRLPLPFNELAVWSGDIVTQDEEGYLYFVGRNDDMIKTSGYRVSPFEIEEQVYQSDLVSEAVALGVPHPVLGQAILLLVVFADSASPAISDIQKLCRQQLPNYMLPQAVFAELTFARNPNGKIDRKPLYAKYQDYFSEN